jgi:hypothetical protein
MAQGIGNIQGYPPIPIYQSSGFSNGFSLGYKRFIEE